MRFCVAKFRGLFFAATASMLIEFLMGLSDSVVAGHLLGETALAAVNLLQSPMNLVSFVACLVGTGTAICFSFEVGRFDRKRACEFFSQGVFGVFALGALLVAAFVGGRDFFLDALGAEGGLRALAVAYWNWFVPCALLEPLAMLLASSCYADGDGRTCIAAYLVQLLGNVGFSVVLVKAMGMGGCALGTVLGNLCAIAVLSVHFFKKSNTLHLVRHFSFADLFRLLGSSFGDASTRLCWAALFFLLNKYAIAHFGAESLPVMGVVIALLGVSEAFNGAPNAAQPLVGVYVGEENYKGVRTVMNVAAKVIVAEGLALTALLLAFPVLAVKLVGISDPALVAQACTAVRVVSLGFVFWAVASLFNSYFLFIGREALSCAFTAAANFLAPYLLYRALGAAFGANGVWAALALAPAVAVFVLGAWILLRHGRARFPYLLPRERDAKLYVFDLTLGEGAICAVSASIASVLRAAGVADRIVSRAALIAEETLMAVKDRNGDKRVRAEAALDLNDGISLVLRDDGEIFDITDADQRISSLRSYLVASLMERQTSRRNLTTTGFNRNVFKFA